MHPLQDLIIARVKVNRANQTIRRRSDTEKQKNVEKNGIISSTHILTQLQDAERAYLTKKIYIFCINL